MRCWAPTDPDPSGPLVVRRPHESRGLPCHSRVVEPISNMRVG